MKKILVTGASGQIGSELIPELRKLNGDCHSSIAVNSKIKNNKIYISCIIYSKNGKSFISQNDHQTGTDRVYEAYEKFYSSKPEVVINLQGDMPNLKPEAIVKINNYMLKKICDVTTLASSIKSKDEFQQQNIVKVETKDNIEKLDFSEAIDFKRNLIKYEQKFVYHHIGVYAFTSSALKKYVNLKRSKLEVKRNLEQMRAMENNIKIHVGYTNSQPLSVDTEDDLEKIKKIMEVK